MSKSKELHKMFHGRDVDRMLEIDISTFNESTLLGTVESISYIAKKHGDRKFHTYEHVFDDPPMLITNGKEMLIVGNFEITERGIVG